MPTYEANYLIKYVSPLQGKNAPPPISPPNYQGEETPSSTNGMKSHRTRENFNKNLMNF